MGEIQWDRLMPLDAAEPSSHDLVNSLKQRVTLIKYRSNGHTYSRIYYLTLSEDAIHYQGSKRRSKHEACAIKDIDQVREGFTTLVWKKFLKNKKVDDEKKKLAFSILHHNNRHSLDLLAESEEICQRWLTGLDYLVRRYRSHLQTYKAITDRWIWESFSRADRDQSGQLSRREAHHLLFELNVELEERQLDEYFNQANIRVNNYDQLANLDREEFLVFYKYVSYRPELLQIICRFNGSTPGEAAAMLSEYHVLKKLSRSLPLEKPPDAAEIDFPRSKSRKKRRHKQGSGQRPKGSAKSKPNPTIATMDKRNFLTVEQLKDFLQTEQQMKTVSIEDCARLITQFEPSAEGQEHEQIGIDGLRFLLLHDEFCLMNPEKSSRVYQDMTRPLGDYFIATSHNTYLRDNQVYGNCTPESYIHVLRTGCRAVEMDCYDGDHMEPMVYHGNTLTKPIPFRDVIAAIETQAFSVSPYPLFLNIENHCSYGQQGVMASVLRGTFKDHLLTKPLVDSFQTLPSPEDLKYKIIVRSRRYPKGKTAADPTSDRSNDETEPHSKDYHPEFSKLIIYSQIVSFSNILHTMSTQRCFHSISFDESKGEDLIHTGDLELLQLTRQLLVRVYPGIRRQDSSNIDPILYWTYGVQMVALNYQANDQAMALQDGFFSDNGRCGYVLKPACLLTTDGSFHPKGRVAIKGKYLSLRIISGQHLPKETKSKKDSDIVDPYVSVYTFGIEGDYSEHQTPSVRNNGLNPMWDYKMRAKISCPELCLLLFKVRDEDRFSAAGLLGQACLPFHSLQSGYRHIKLKGKDGDYNHGTLFVHVTIEDA